MKKFKFILTNLFAFTTVITPISLFTTSCYRFDPSKGDYMMMNINHWNSEYGNAETETFDFWIQPLRTPDLKYHNFLNYSDDPFYFNPANYGSLNAKITINCPNEYKDLFYITRGGLNKEDIQINFCSHWGAHFGNAFDMSLTIEEDGIIYRNIDTVHFASYTKEKNTDYFYAYLAADQHQIFGDFVLDQNINHMRFVGFEVKDVIEHKGVIYPIIFNTYSGGNYTADVYGFNYLKIEDNFITVEDNAFNQNVDVTFGLNGGTTRTAYKDVYNELTYQGYQTPFYTEKNTTQVGNFGMPVDKNTLVQQKAGNLEYGRTSDGELREQSNGGVAVQFDNSNALMNGIRFDDLSKIGYIGDHAFYECYSLYQDLINLFGKDNAENMVFGDGGSNGTINTNARYVQNQANPGEGIGQTATDPYYDGGSG